MNVELLCRRVLEALVNGGYQGLLLTIAVMAALVMMRRSSAATRHNICLITLLLVALLPAAHFARATSRFQWLAEAAREDSSVPDVRIAGITGKVEKDSVTSTVMSTESERPMVSDGEVDYGRQTRRQDCLRDMVPGEPSDRNLEGAVFETVKSGLGGDAPSSGFSGEAGKFTRSTNEPDVRRWKKPVLSFSSRQCVPIVVAIALLGLVRSAALAWQLFMLRALKRKAAKAPDHLQARFRAMGSEMGLRRSVTLLVGKNEGPCAIGFLRPTVIVPQNILKAEEADAILRHELAHIDRRDDWASLFQQLVVAIFFFHPAVWMLSRRLSMEREIACDDQVLAARPNRRNYALLLTEFAGQPGGSRFTAAPAAWGRKTQLKRRIDMILNKNRNSSPRSSRRSVGMMGVGAVLAAALGIMFAPQVAVAQATTEPASPEEEIASEDVVPPRAGVAIAAPVPVAPRRPRVAVAAVMPVAPGIPYIAAEPPDALEPARPGSAPRKARARADGSVEERLDRLEKMIEELVGREKGGFSYGTYGKGSAFHDAWQGHDPREIARMQRELERANKEVERAAKDAARSLQEAQKNWNFEGFQNFQWGDFKNPKAHRKALEAQRKALEKQLQAVEQRIDALQDEEEEFGEKVQEKEDRIKEKIKEKQNKPLEKAESAPENTPKR